MPSAVKREHKVEASSSSSDPEPGAHPQSAVGRWSVMVMWALIVSLVVAIQWPALKGWYYKYSGVSAPVDRIPWKKELRSALVEAGQTGKPVLLVFSASWCPPCQIMKHEVWPDERVRLAITRNYVPVMLDPEDAPEEAARYQADGIPTILALDAQGRVLRRANYLPADDLLHFLSPQG